MRFLVPLFLLVAVVASAQDFVVEVTIPTEIALDTRDAFAERFDYDRHSEPGESKVTFAKRMIRRLVVETYVNYMVAQAADTAGDTAGAAAEVAAATVTVQ